MYAKIDAWHIVTFDDEHRTLCGERLTIDHLRNQSFGTESTCELCFRIQALREAEAISADASAILDETDSD